MTYYVWFFHEGQKFGCRWIFMRPPPPSVTWEVYCFPHRQLISSFGRRVISFERSLKFISKSVLFVCTMIFKRIVGLHFYPWCYASVVSSRQALQTNWKLFSNFNFVFKLLAKNFKTTWILIEVQCITYQWIWIDKLYKLMEFFFLNFWIIFLIM